MEQWKKSGDVNASYVGESGYKSDYSLKHYSASAYKVSTYQTIEDLENGYYTLTAWTQNGGGQKASYLYAGGGNGTSQSRTALPVSSSWTKVTVRGIHVTTGEVTMGLYSDANAGNWVNMDSVELIKDDQGYKFLKGGDVSELTYVESKGGKFYDENGNEKDLFQILKEQGHDIVRLRVYNDPGKGHGDGRYYRPAGIMDKDDMLKLAVRSKAVGLQIQLSFHYSDYWTNGETHNIPHEWQEAISNLSTDADKVTTLKGLLYDYTLEVMQAMKDQGTTPEFVSLGNEMQGGILYPYGRASSITWDNLATFLKEGYRAVKEVSPSSRVILHLDGAGDYDKYNSFFDAAKARGVEYDIIGPSYYPFWTKNTVQEIVEFCNFISKKYDKDIMIMETGYNWNPTLPNGIIGQLNNNGPYLDDTSSQAGQRDFMYELFNGLKSVDNGRVIGDLYWDPIMIAVPDVGWAIKEEDDKPDLNVVSNTTLFDFDGKTLLSHLAYKYNTESVTDGNISGIVRGVAGRNIANATVTVTAGGKQLYKAETDHQGNYFIANVPVGVGYTVNASKNGYETGNAVSVGAVIAGEITTNANITLIGGAISGIVRDEDGNPVKDITVSTTAQGEVLSTNSNANGQYTLSDLPVGTFKVHAFKLGYSEGSARDVTVANRTTSEDIDLTILMD